MKHVCAKKPLPDITHLFLTHFVNYINAKNVTQ
jgi:hypothetical protein